MCWATSPCRTRRSHGSARSKRRGSCKRARLSSSFPNGYDAEVKERGATLSVGQRQLLAFARAVAFDPKILILDEATANIDSQTESLIQESLQKILRGRTSITIAHRLSTIRESDKIIVLHKGVVVEQGTHEELLARKGLYYALYTLQFAEAEAVKAE
jgi:ATP-binding cassette subfamily B multidrug efflux pump